MTDDLIAFIRQQLAEDERVARAAANHGATWRDGSGKTLIYPSDEARHPGPIIIGPYGDLEAEHTDHIVRWDPARVLAEVEAKRRILDEYEGYASDDDPDHEHAQFAANAALALEGVIKLLAQPYAGHSGFREEWRA